MIESQTKNLTPQVFTIWSDEIDDRLDPRFYHPDFMEFGKKLAKVKNIKTLEEISEYIGSGSTPLAGGDAYVSKEEGIPFIRITNLTDGHIDLSDVLYIKSEIHNGMLKRTGLKNGDILLSMAGTIGLIAVVGDDIGEANINQALARIVLKNSYNRQYVATILSSKIGKIQTDRLSRPSVQANLNLDEIKSLKIPLPSLSVQNKIVEMMAKAYAEKKEKETEAEKLLGLIDDFMLEELGIKISEIKKEMVFEVWSDEMKNRLDPEYYQKNYKTFIDEIKKSKFPKEKLENITEFVISGRTPAKDDYAENEEDGIPIIKAGTASGELVNLKKLGYVKNGFEGKRTVKKGDIFILSAAHQAEYVGKNVSLLDEEPGKDTYFVGELINVRANPEKCLSGYLFSFLSSHFIFILINREKRGQTSHLYSDDLKNLFIPLPPLAVQKKIADRLKSYRDQSQTLQNEAQEVLAKAKEKVEKIILG